VHEQCHKLVLYCPRICGEVMQGELMHLHSPMPLRILLTNSNVGWITKALVAGVGKRALRHPEAMAAIFEAIDHIADEVVSILLSQIQGWT
jgi:mevalonate kinase